LGREEAEEEEAMGAEEGDEAGAGSEEGLVVEGAFVEEGGAEAVVPVWPANSRRRAHRNAAAAKWRAI
jgi:hypothetical protein